MMRESSHSILALQATVTEVRGFWDERGHTDAQVLSRWDFLPKKAGNVLLTMYGIRY